MSQNPPRFIEETKERTVLGDVVEVREMSRHTTGAAPTRLPSGIGRGNGTRSWTGEAPGCG